MLAAFIIMQIIGLGGAVAALFLDWPYPVLVIGVIVFLVGGHFTRVQLRRGRATQPMR